MAVGRHLIGKGPTPAEVDAFLADPERPLRLLSLTSPEEIKHLLEWNRPTNELVDARSGFDSQTGTPMVSVRRVDKARAPLLGT